MRPRKYTKITLEFYVPKSLAGTRRALGVDKDTPTSLVREAVTAAMDDGAPPMTLAEPRLEEVERRDVPFGVRRWHEPEPLFR